MKAFSSVVAVATMLPVMAAAQPFWPGAPSCVQSCVSSAWTSSSTFPVPTDFCGTSASPVASCLSASCGSTSSLASTWSSLSSSLCSAYSSCVSAGSTGVVTVTATGSGGPWGGPFASNHPGGGPWKGGPSGTYTFTGGCPWATGAPWGFGGPGFPGGPGGPGGWWGSSLSGWAYQTRTTTVTTTFTTSGAVVTATGPATVEEAASGSQTSATTLFDGAQVTGTTSSNAGAGPARVLSVGGNGGGDWATVKILGVALGAILAVVGML